jgi:peptide deformylase
MPSSNIIKLGNPVLRLNSQSVDTSEFESGGIGLAAPQIGVNKRLFVFGVKNHPIYTHGKAIPETVLINPSIKFLSENIEESYEGCLSVGALRGKVPRHTRIYYKGYNEKGLLVEGEAEGLHARVIQHEYDHLNGVIFLDRIRNYESLGFHDELVISKQLPLNN